jgi:hypothetical protein
MSSKLTLFQMPQLQIPAHIGSFFGEEKNIVDRHSVPSLGYEGKVWQMNVNGEKTKLVKKNDEGDEEPLSTMRVVILDYGKKRGRAYYEGAYDPAKIGSPVCWSDDGMVPHASIATPQCASCDKCPLAVKGSKISENGKSVTACSQHRMVAVLPANNLEFVPLRLKLAITSDYDKQSPELEAQNWYAFSNYTDFLRSKGVQHTAALVTKMKFDPNVAYPKVMFSPDRWLEAHELAQVASVVRSDAVKSLLAGTYTPAGVDGVPIAAPVMDDEDEAPAPAPKAAKAKPAPAPVVMDDDDDDVEILPVAAPVKAAPAPKAPKAAPAAPKAPAAKPAPAAAPVMVMDDDDDEAPAPKAAPKAAPAPAAVGDDVASLLAEWGDD